MTIKTKGLLTVLSAYIIALFLGFVSLKFSSHHTSMFQILIADVIATFILLAFSIKILLFMIHTGLLSLHLLLFFG